MKRLLAFLLFLPSLAFAGATVGSSSGGGGGGGISGATSGQVIVATGATTGTSYAGHTSDSSGNVGANSLSLPSTPNTANTTTGMILANYQGSGVYPELSLYGGNLFLGGAGSSSYSTTGTGTVIGIGYGGSNSNTLVDLASDDTSGSIAIGASVLPAATSVANTIAIGYNVGLSHTGNSGDNAILIGSNVVSTRDTSQAIIDTTIIGNFAGEDIISPTHVTTLGYFVLDNAGTANYDTIVGSYSLPTSSTSTAVVNYTAVLGDHVLQPSNSSYYNTAVGSYAGEATTLTTSASGLVLIGYSAGKYVGANNAFYLNNVDQGSTANDQDYSLLYGNFSGTAASLTGQQLTVNGVLNVGTAGVSGSSLVLHNATSGGITLSPPTGALGSAVITIPDATDTVDLLGTAQTFTATKTFSGSLGAAFPSSVTTASELFATADQVTNVSGFVQQYASSTYEIGGVTKGTGSTVPIAFFSQSNNGGAYFSRLDLLISSGSPLLREGMYTSAAGTTNNNVGTAATEISFANFNLTNTTGNQVIFGLSPVYNQASGSGTNTDFQINRTETALSSGTQNFAAFYAGTSGTTLEWAVSNKGVTTTAGLLENGSTFSGTVTLTAGSGTITSAAITTSGVIVLSIATSGGTPGTSTPKIVMGAGSAAITGLSTDTSTYNWRLIQ